MFKNRPDVPLIFALKLLRSLFLLTTLMLTSQLLVSCGGGGGGGTPPGGTDGNPGDGDPGDGDPPPPPPPPPTENVAPVAVPGAYQVVTPNDMVTLDGTESYDANKDSLSYSWKFSTKPGGSQAVLANPYTAKPTFTADLKGKYIIELVVNDGELDSMVASVTVMAAAFSVTVNWSPNSDSPDGYAVYAGPTSTTATQLVQTLVSGSGGWNPAAPSTDIDSTTILEAVGAGTQACFVIKAYNGADTSLASESTCIDLPK